MATLESGGFDVIPESVRRAWDAWNLRSFIILSLTLQTFLIIFAPFRKRSSNMVINFLVWSSYLLADWAAAFAVGLISKSQDDKNKGSMDNRFLLALWAPFLLVHLGGPDTITAFALEDNALWLRHLLGLLFQVIAVGYVFLQTLPKNRLWIPTAFMLIAGLIKYAERTRALYLASLDKFKESMLKEADAGPNYAKLMDEFASRKEAHVPARIEIIAELNKDNQTTYEVVTGTIEDSDIVKHAYYFFGIFKGLIVDLIFSFRERHESRKFFQDRTADDTFKIISVELNFMYEVLFTKVVVVHSFLGYAFRSLSIASVVASLIIFWKESHRGFKPFDVGITYTLLYGAVALEAIAFVKSIFSDWTIAIIKSVRKGTKLEAFFKVVPDCFLGWYASHLMPKWVSLDKHRDKYGDKYCYKHGDKYAKYAKYSVLNTPILLRRWSESVRGYNLITYSLRQSPEVLIPKLRPRWFTIICEIIFFPFKIIAAVLTFLVKIIVKINSCWLFVSVFRFVFYIPSKVIKWIDEKAGLTEFYNGVKYVSKNAFIKELWDFIFEDLQVKGILAEDPVTARTICNARGDWILKYGEWKDEGEEMMQYVQKDYDQSLLLWHTATELCYNMDRSPSEELTDKEKDWRMYSKILSDYMLYLLVRQPTLMSVIAGISQIRYRDTCAEAEKFFDRRKLGRKYKLNEGKLNEDKLNEACNEILDVDTAVEPHAVKGDRSKSVLFDASMLAKKLKTLKGSKWKLISKVWVELLSYAASHCRANNHAALLSKGGELVTFVWLLMAHLGVGEQFQINEGHARAKLIIRP